METAERNPERLFARDVVATYDKLVVRDEDGVVMSRPADAVMMRDVLWLIMSPDPDLREMGLYVMSAGSPRMQAELYARVRHDEQAQRHVANPGVEQGRSVAAKPVDIVTVRLRRGSYRYICTVPGHAAAGMKGTFRVT